jgi:hypothetical protein
MIKQCLTQKGSEIMNRTRIAEIANKIAKALVAKDYEYIYDPEHKKHPGGGYVKT